MHKLDSKYQSFVKLNELDLGQVVDGDDLGIQISYILSAYGSEYQEILPDMVETVAT